MGNRPSASVGLVGPPEASGWPPQARLLTMTSGIRIYHVLNAVTVLGVADRLAGGPRSADEIAGRIGCDPDALGRLLRAAATVGILERENDDRYALTDVSELLRSDVPHSLREAVLYAGHEVTWRPYGSLVDAIRSGDSEFGKIFGSPFYDYCHTKADIGELMRNAMDRLSSAASAALLDLCDLHRFDHVADVGGGLGGFLVEVLRRNPAAKGILVDRPDVVEAARRSLAGRPEYRRITPVGQDFFTDLPRGCGAYILKSVLHNWGDGDAARILRNVRGAIGGNGEARLFVVEQVIGPPNRWDNGALLDIDMLLKFGGRVRDLDEWGRLLGDAGFEPANEPRIGSWTVMAWRPC